MCVMTTRHAMYYEMLHWVEESAGAVKLQGTRGSVKPEYSEQNRALQRREQQGFPKMIGKRGIRVEGHAQQEVCKRRGPFL